MHLVVAISAHGFGHAAQTTAVLNALHSQLPDMKLTLLTAVRRSFLAERLNFDFEYREWAGDFGMQMHSALEVDCAGSAAKYAKFHAQWREEVVQASEFIGSLGADLLLANVSYLALAAAADIELPSVGFCSLNWAGIYRHYFADRPEAPALLAQMESAYNSARVFMCPFPSMPMPELDNIRQIGPIARHGRMSHAELCAGLGVDPSQRVVTIAPGGIALRIPLQTWPHDPRISWIIPGDWDVVRDDMFAFERLGMAFIDVLSASDALLGKLGYGTVAECACNATPMLYMPRSDWPEEPYLAAWLSQHGRCLPVSRQAVMCGQIGEVLDQLWQLPAPPAPVPDGAPQAAAILARQLNRACPG